MAHNILVHNSDPFSILLCNGCGDNEWEQDNGTVLLCSCCGNKIVLHDNVVDYSDPTGSNSHTVKQWEKQYSSPSSCYSAANDWMRITTWRKHLFQYLPSDLTDMLVVDVGCGTSDRVAAIIPIKEYGYRYVGIDSSEVALRRAALNMTESMLIRAHLRTVRLRSEIADVVLCLGVLMYFDDVTDLLGKLVNLLKPGGVLLLHEAMSMRSTESVLGRLRVTEGAPFPEWHGVCRSKVSSQLKEHGKIIHLHLASSPLRRVLSRIPPSPWLRSLRSAGAGLDSIWCGTVGRFAKKLGPAEFQLVFKKAGR